MRMSSAECSARSVIPEPQMRKNLHYLFILAIILTLSVFLLPGVQAARESIKPASTDNSASGSRAVNIWQLLLANFMLPDPTADLSVTKTVNSDQVESGANVTY